MITVCITVLVYYTTLGLLLVTAEHPQLLGNKFYSVSYFTVFEIIRFSVRYIMITIKKRKKSTVL